MAKSQLLDRLAPFMMSAAFCAAIVMLVREFSNVSAREVVVRLAVLPMQQRPCRYFQGVGRTKTV